jgi:hypothetical protein
MSRYSLNPRRQGRQKMKSIRRLKLCCISILFLQCICSANGLSASRRGGEELAWGTPSLLDGIECDDWRDCSIASHKLTNILRAEFPLGTSEAALESALRAQGFEHLPTSITHCTRPGGHTPYGAKAIACPAWDANWDPKHYLKYQSGGPGLFCSHGADVLWSSDKKGRLTHLEAYYVVACL